MSGNTKAKKDKIHSDYASSWAFKFSIPSKKYISNYITKPGKNIRIQEYKNTRIQEYKNIYKNTRLNGPNPVAGRLGLVYIYTYRVNYQNYPCNKTKVRWK